MIDPSCTKGRAVLAGAKAPRSGGSGTLLWPPQQRAGHRAHPRDWNLRSPRSMASDAGGAYAVRTSLVVFQHKTGDGCSGGLERPGEEKRLNRHSTRRLTARGGRKLRRVA